MSRIPNRVQKSGRHKKEIVPGKMNRHVERCGIPPTLDSRHPTKYFENYCGGQWVVQYDLEKGVCMAWGGDLGWGKELRVELFKGVWIIVRYEQNVLKNKKDRWEKVIPLEELKKIEEELRRSFENRFGKLSDEEFATISHCPLLDPSEYDELRKFYEIYHSAYSKSSEKKDKEDVKKLQEEIRELRQKEVLNRRKSTEAERLRLKEKESLLRELRQEEAALINERKKLVRERREEIRLLRQKISDTRRLIRGETEPVQEEEES